MILQHNPLDDYKRVGIKLVGMNFVCCHSYMPYVFEMFNLPWIIYFDNNVVAICHDCETIYYTDTFI